MSAQQLDRVLTPYRIGDPHGRYPIFDATGSTLGAGRWNSTTSPIIYTAERYSTALLEKLMHGSGQLPPNQHFIEITLPDGLSYEVVEDATLPDWHKPDCLASRAYGDAWQQEKRSVILIVPSVVARLDRNFLLNPDHPQFGRITHGLHRPVWWDSRLFT